MAKRQRKKTQASPKETSKDPQTALGTLRLNPRGFGFVVPEDKKKHPDDIFIPKHLVGNAVDGDTVLVSLNPNPNLEKGPDGKIEEITQRGREFLAGTINHIDGTITANVPILGEGRIAVIEKTKKELCNVGDRVILRVDEWGDRKTPTICKIHKKIGHIDDSSIDITAALEEFDLPRQFPQEAINQAKAFGESVEKDQTKGRLDLSKATCLTIDPDTAKDFDDALSIDKDQKGHFFLGVHIADVAHYIKPGTPLDIEAKKRSNSTYFPGKCVPMLPEELSNNLCSLKQGEIRLTVSVLAEFDPEGTVVSFRAVRSFIKSRKRFTYGEAKAVLDGKKKSRYTAQLKQMEELCLLLKKKRTERGSIDFALPELILNLDENGQPTGVRIEEYHITHQMVEEFMLKANELVAISIDKMGKTPLYRTHEQPNEENMEEFYALGRSLGFNVPQKPTTEDLQALFDEAKKTPFSQQLTVGFIRNLKLANYSPKNVGHFGLALEHYCHFTSPIRRYSDLITERLLFDEEGDNLDLDAIGLDCSEKERISFRAEMSVKKLKKLRLLQHWVKEDPEMSYEGYVTKIKPFGLFFEIKELFLEGFLHISEIGSDYYLFEPKIPMIYGRGGKEEFRFGTPVSVRPVNVDLIHLETNWERIVPKKRKKKKQS